MIESVNDKNSNLLNITVDGNNVKQSLLSEEGLTVAASLSSTLIIAQSQGGQETGEIKAMQLEVLNVDSAVLTIVRRDGSQKNTVRQLQIHYHSRCNRYNSAVLKPFLHNV